MTAPDERTARMTLATVSEPADIITGTLVARVGPIETLALLESRAGLPSDIDPAEGELWRRRLAARLSPDEPGRIAADMDRHQLRMITPDDAVWPTELRHLGATTPLVLWLRGDPARLTGPLEDRVTIVGARAATTYGDHVAGGLATDLAGRGKVIVTGGAYGIDAAAIRAVTTTTPGRVVVVLASGLDRPYPTGHEDLFPRVAATGGLLVSELPPGSAPTKWRFLQRGRLLAALGSATIVVEAGPRSGSLYVASIANALGRTVAAVPGPLTSPASAGTNHLIQEGHATLVVNAEDVVTLTDPAVRFASERTFTSSQLSRQPARRGADLVR